MGLGKTGRAEEKSQRPAQAGCFPAAHLLAGRTGAGGITGAVASAGTGVTGAGTSGTGASAAGTDGNYGGKLYNLDDDKYPPNNRTMENFFRGAWSYHIHNQASCH